MRLADFRLEFELHPEPFQFSAFFDRDSISIS